ncbi:hypothetical protein Lysil_1377 [Lysobacter silvestris]|uniref:Uncharacterized protein n=1 Tax=Solilutibacter silvestris TaxID=1645665 RepID=A0A2K1Q3Y5_9GAMM|nr:hypothetical protein Lysil_1377 [Lysobacter silvestris]
MSNDPRYWFPTKRYGWGWGLPIAWQGWVVLALFIASALIGSYYIQPHRNHAIFAVFIICLIGLLTFVMWLKGEPPSWHWGNRE